jgi:xanthine/uracil permease
MKLPSFLIELVKRFATNNPKFFKGIQVLSGIIAIIAFLPDLASYLEFELPTWLNLLHDKAIKIGSLTAILMAQLPNEQSK